MVGPLDVVGFLLAPLPKRGCKGSLHLGRTLKGALTGTGEALGKYGSVTPLTFVLSAFPLSCPCWVQSRCWLQGEKLEAWKDTGAGWAGACRQAAHSWRFY